MWGGRAASEETMRTERLRAEVPEDVARAAELLRQGKVVAFPTETVYGLGGRADDPAVVDELRRLKGRVREKPFALLIPCASDMARYGTPGAVAQALARAFWPGPLTIVVPDGKGGDVGLRCPDCAPTLGLLRQVGTAVAAPSANLSGRRPATTARGVLRAFDGKISAVLDGGRACLGRASTVVRVTGDRAEVLREGALPVAQVLDVAGQGG
jgi:L-threonylcarbamoyladenylate synthase